MNATCEKNEAHIYQNIKFEDFDKYYLKKRTVEVCFRCGSSFDSIDNNYTFKCIICDKFYCSICIFLDEHVKKHLSNFKFEINGCPKCYNRKYFYCLNCRQNICYDCYIGDINRQHSKHEVINILCKIPSKYQIDSLKDVINKKSSAFNELINNLNIWQKQFIEKIETLKKNLKYEISILKKLFLN